MIVAKERRQTRKKYSQKVNRYGNTVTTVSLCSKDLKDPPKNLEKDFRLNGHFYPHDDIFRVD